MKEETSSLTICVLCKDGRRQKVQLEEQALSGDQERDSYEESCLLNVASNKQQSRQS